MTAFRPPDPDAFDGHGPDHPAPARMYDYMLGGKDNYPADREAARRVTAIIPDLPDLAKANRAFLARAVTRAARAGVTQFLDLGSGMPTSPNVHETAMAVSAGARVVYVDRDPVVIVHSRVDREAPGTGFVRADLRDPTAVLGSGVVAGLIDLARPVAVLLIAVLHFCDGDITPVVDAYKQAVPAGSWLAISHAASDGADPGSVSAVASVYGEGASPQARTTAQVRALFDGWDLLDPPGLADVRQWAGAAAPGPGRLQMPAGIAVKP